MVKISLFEKKDIKNPSLLLLHLRGTKDLVLKKKVYLYFWEAKKEVYNVLLVDRKKPRSFAKLPGHNISNPNSTFNMLNVLTAANIE